MKRRILLGACVAGGVLAIMTTRVVCSSRAEYERGHTAETEALKRTDPRASQRGFDDAVTHYRRAARWYAPINPYVSRSLDGLWRVGQLQEKRGDRSAALKAYRAIRRAILGARSFYTPHKSRLGSANRRIARLSAEVQGGVDAAAGTKKASAAQIKRFERWHLVQLENNTAPSVAWSILALLGFGAWVGGAFTFIYRAITPEDELLPRPALIWGVVIAAGLLLWVLGLSLA